MQAIRFRFPILGRELYFMLRNVNENPSVAIVLVYNGRIFRHPQEMQAIRA